jgi:hypothetical protein
MRLVIVFALLQNVPGANKIGAQRSRGSKGEMPVE